MYQAEFLELGISLKGRQTGELKTKCPQCHQTRKNKTDDSLSVNVEKGFYNCHNCGWSGSVRFKPKKEYIKPPTIELKLSDKIVQWFKGRGISEATLLHWKIGESETFIPHVKKTAQQLILITTETIL